MSSSMRPLPKLKGEDRGEGSLVPNVTLTSPFPSQVAATLRGEDLPPAKRSWLRIIHCYRERGLF